MKKQKIKITSSKNLGMIWDLEIKPLKSIHGEKYISIGSKLNKEKSFVILATAKETKKFATILNKSSDWLSK